MQTERNADSHTVYPDLEQIVVFGDDGPSPRRLIDTDRLTSVVGGLRAGQAVPHHPSAEAIYHFVKGTGTMSVDDETFAVQAGATVAVADGAFRGMRASSDIVFLGTRAPETGYGEHGHTH